MNIYKIKFINGDKMRITAKTEFLARRHASQYGTVASCEETVSRWWYLIYPVAFLLGVYGANVMRDLTEEELKLAPSGFLEYGFNRSGEVFFFNRDRGVAVIDGVDYELKLSKWHYAYIECKPIPKPSKPFDITKHDFSDWEISSADFEYDEFTLRFFEVNAIHLNKDDAIAIAKALGVTGEDLK